jgi:hypothetical protein
MNVFVTLQSHDNSFSSLLKHVFVREQIIRETILEAVLAVVDQGLANCFFLESSRLPFAFEVELPGDVAEAETR